MTKYSKKYTCTDASTGQKGRQLTKTSFEFKEGDKHEVIHLDGITFKEVEDCINSYGYTLYETSGHNVNIYELYKEPMWIIAECLFEQNY